MVYHILALLAKYPKNKNREEILKCVRDNEAFRQEEDWVSEFLDLIDQGKTNLSYPEFKKNKLQEWKERLIKQENLKREGVMKLIDKWVKEKSINYKGVGAKDNIMPDDIDFTVHWKNTLKK